jgi:hypothetical protein
MAVSGITEKIFSRSFAAWASNRDLHCEWKRRRSRTGVPFRSFFNGEEARFLAAAGQLRVERFEFCSTAIVSYKPGALRRAVAAPVTHRAGSIFLVSVDKARERHGSSRSCFSSSTDILSRASSLGIACFVPSRVAVQTIFGHNGGAADFVPTTFRWPEEIA